MTDHRAPRPTQADGSSVPSSSAPGRRRAIPSSDLTGPVPVTPYVGKRIAPVAPVAAAAPVVAPTATRGATRFDDDSTVVMALVGEPGRRKAARGAAARTTFKNLPSAPALVGAAALAISVGGALTAASAPHLASASPATVHAANSMNGSGGVSSFSAMTARSASVSRSSDRQALAAKAGVATSSLKAATESQVAQRNVALEQLARKAEGQARHIKANQWGLPIDAGVYHLTARFGDYGLWSSFHTGLDFACPTGTPIHAIATGVITFAAYDGAYGNKTIETLPDGTELWYGHQTAFNVASGDHVVEGQIIGFVGSTGHTTGPHVHIEVRPGGGDPVDPFPAMVQHGLTP